MNFYGNLMKKVDGDLVRLLRELDRLHLTDSTVVIKTADHGEMGMAHGGQYQKMFNA
jgi:arylsulfatase A-like enzyme